MLSILIAPLKLRVIIWGTWAISKLPGIWLPSTEQKQSGITHSRGSHLAAALGSSSTVHETSSEPSEQSGLLSQNKILSIHSPLPHWSWLSGQTGSSVLRLGKTTRGLVNLSQLSTWKISVQRWSVCCTVGNLLPIAPHCFFLPCCTSYTCNKRVVNLCIWPWKTWKSSVPNTQFPSSLCPTNLKLFQMPHFCPKIKFFCPKIRWYFWNISSLKASNSEFLFQKSRFLTQNWTKMRKIH